MNRVLAAALASVLLLTGCPVVIAAIAMDADARDKPRRDREEQERRARHEKIVQLRKAEEAAAEERRLQAMAGHYSAAPDAGTPAQEPAAIYRPSGVEAELLGPLAPRELKSAPRRPLSLTESAR